MDFTEIVIRELNSDHSKIFMASEFKQSKKNSELAKQMRLIGNHMFYKCTHDVKIHETIWDSYLNSIALAPTESEELALSYTNLSELLYHFKKYQDCIETVDRALEITESPVLKVKLLCRKANSLQALRKEEKFDILKEAEIWLEKISNQEKNKEKYVKLVKKTNLLLNEVAANNQSHMNINVLDKVLKSHQLFNAESISFFDSVSIHFNKKYGTQLISTRDISPGEIIFVTKPYVLIPNIKKRQNFCNNCLTAVWSAVPCKNCTLCMFCSENCYEVALSNFHDIECKVVGLIFGKSKYDYQLHASLRAVIMAVKEFGSIEKLKDVMNSLMNSAGDDDEFSQQCNNNSFINLFGFKNVTTDNETLSFLAEHCCKIVIALAKYSSLFGNSYNFDTTESLIRNSDVIFIGNLLLKVAVIFLNNGTKIKEPDSTCKNGIDQNACDIRHLCCERGYSVNTLHHLISHSCDPNVNTIKMEGGKELCYALKPIYKGYPLLECYGPAFYEKRLSERFKITERILNKSCVCKACVNNWPALLFPNDEPISFEELFRIVVESRELDSEKKKFISLVSKWGLAHQKSVNELSRILTASCEYFNKPSVEVCAAIRLLNYAFEGLHGINFDMPYQC